MPGRIASRLAPVVLMLALRLPAQQLDATTIPRELAVAFARGYAPPDSNIAVDFFPGALPPSAAAQVAVPPGARLLGTVVVARNTFVLLSTIATPDSVLAWYARDYRQRGWSDYSIARIMQDQSGRGGFRQPQPERPSSFCSGGMVADISATHGRDGFTSARVFLHVVTGTLACPTNPGGVRPAVPVNAPGGASSALPLPILYDPPNSQAMGPCFPPGPTQQTQTQLQTSLDPATLAQHYGKQLQTQGWSPMVAEYPIARTAFTRRDSAGATEIATLSVAVNPSAPMCRNATLDVLTIRSR